MIHFCSHTFASRLPKTTPPLAKRHNFPLILRRVEKKWTDSDSRVPWPPVQLGASLLPDAPVSTRRP